MSLAVEGYSGIELADNDHTLNLCWTLDEQPFLEPEIGHCIAATQRATGALAHWYPVDDPYGHETLAPTIASVFQVDPACITVTCGAGVGGLLHSLAARLAGRTVGILSECSPDFPEWLTRFGAVPVLGPSDRADILFVERPSLKHNSPYDDLAMLERLCARGVALIIIDESYANYLPNEASAIRLLPGHDNLIVLRGASKAFSMGALRLGCAVSRARPANAPPMDLPAMQVSSASMHLGRALFAMSETKRAILRDRIAEAKAECREALLKAGLAEPVWPHPSLPHFMYDEHGKSAHRDAAILLQRLGILGKKHMIWNGNTGTLRRYSVPLDLQRMARFKRMLDVVSRQAET
ncbi:MAG: aminotransferase class I/II-fold pyridoxal phosphate-dependent enzyme [Pseudomonadota bacterium]